MAPRLATLHNPCYTGDGNDDDVANGGHGTIGERVRALKPASPGEKLVYWESQGKDRMCALHCLNTLLQGPVFTEIDLSTVALHLDNQERQLMYAASGNNAESDALLAGGSCNAADDGFFSISVLEQCLSDHGVACIPTSQLFESQPAIDPSNFAEGFLCHHHDHWFAVRRIWDQWYNLDSLKPAPALLGELYVSAFLHKLKQDGYSVFQVILKAGLPLPLPNASTLTRPLNRNQFFLSKTQIIELGKSHEEKEAKALQQTAARYGGQEASKPPSAMVDLHAWTRSSGRQIGEAPKSTQIDADVSNDPDLARALQLSLMDFTQNLPKSAEEPGRDEEDVLTLQVRLPDQSRVTRRFRHTDTATDVCLWIESVAQPLILPLTQYQLIAEFPRRVLLRGNRTTVLRHPCIDGSESDNVTSIPLRQIFDCNREQLVLTVL